MHDAEKTPNVVKACNKPGLFEELEDIQKRQEQRSSLVLLALMVDTYVCVFTLQVVCV